MPSRGSPGMRVGTAERPLKTGNGDCPGCGWRVQELGDTCPCSLTPRAPTWCREAPGVSAMWQVGRSVDGKDARAYPSLAAAGVALWPAPWPCFEATHHPTCFLQHWGGSAHFTDGDTEAPGRSAGRARWLRSAESPRTVCGRAQPLPVSPANAWRFPGTHSGLGTVSVSHQCGKYAPSSAPLLEQRRGPAAPCGASRAGHRSPCHSLRSLPGPGQPRLRAAHGGTVQGQVKEPEASMSKGGTNPGDAGEQGQGTRLGDNDTYVYDFNRAPAHFSHWHRLSGP